MGFHQDDDTPVYEDNTACIEWGNHIIGDRERAKHIDIRKHGGYGVEDTFNKFPEVRHHWDTEIGKSVQKYIPSIFISLG